MKISILKTGKKITLLLQFKLFSSIYSQKKYLLALPNYQKLKRMLRRIINAK